MSKIAKTLKENLEKIPLKPCKQCGYLTKREFCRRFCRMIYNDNRIESVEEERDKYKAALELITDYGCTGEDARDMIEIAINALTEASK